jgi:hypothetical protein
MSINPLNDISQVYLEQVASQEFELDEGMTLKDFKANRRKLKRKEASADAKKRGHVGKEWYNSGRTYSPDEAKSGRANMPDHERQTRHRSAVDPDNDNDDMYSADKTKNPKKLRKQKAMGELGESVVPGKPAERLGAVTAIPKSEQEEARDRILAKTKAKREAQKPNDGNLANNYPPYDKITRGDVIAGRLGKDEMGGKKKKSKGMKEGFSNWRQDLSEVITDEIDSKPIKEKKVKNKIKINPTLGEAVEQIGGTLIEMVEIEDFDGIFDEMSESEIFFLNDSLIEQVVEDVFLECLEEGYDIEDIENTLVESLEISSALLNEAKVTLGHDTKIKSDRLEKVKSAVKKVGKGIARGAGYAAGAIARGASAVKREFGKGYEKGRGSSSSDSTSSSSSSSSTKSSSSSDSGSSKPGLLSRIGSKLKSGLKRVVAKGARAVSRGARNVARKMEGGETKKVEAPKTEPKKAEKPADPWGEPTTPPKSKPKATTKKAAAPKAKAPARKKKASKLDSLLSDIRNEEIGIQEAGDWWHPDPKKDRQISGAGNKMRAKENRGQDTSAQTKPDYSRRLKPGETYMQFAKRKEAERMKKEEFQIDEKTLTKMEMKKREEIVKSMKDKASDFEKRYPGRGKEVMYATATKMAKKMAEQALPIEAPSPESGIDKKKEMMDKQKLANMKMLQQKQQMLQKQRLQMQKSGKLPLEAD